MSGLSPLDMRVHSTQLSSALQDARLYAHYPKTSFTIVADTPENLRLKQQSKMQSHGCVVVMSRRRSSISPEYGPDTADYGKPRDKQRD
ncbi:LIM and SH3 domain protein 1 [Anabarilius grahami]|uniref:LIM and SH3 domain protein 1 n=1 Tax=Anabarilius grahami TaxID=495550 RepID=A0A3N0Z1Q3_ANAGA|nr:LIM and SH3 domain protein 1 [Anabarilius grahami]